MRAFVTRSVSDKLGVPSAYVSPPLAFLIMSRYMLNVTQY